MATPAEQHLAEAEQHLAEAEARIVRQRMRISELVADGHDTGAAEAVLATLLVNLDALHKHRANLLKEVAAERAARP